MKKIVGIDFGSANTFIYYHGHGLVFSEPTVIAYDINSGKPIEIGYMASKLIGRSPESINVIKPVVDGVPSSMNPSILFLKHALKKANIRSLKGCDVIFAIPSKITSINKMSLFDIAKAIGARKITFENQAKLAAYSANAIDRNNRGTMSINLGAGSTSIVVCSSDNVLIDRYANFSGNLIDEAILRYLRKNRHLIVGQKTAEFIKMKIGSVELNSENRLLEVSGRDILTSLPHNVTISTSEVKSCLLPLAESLIDSISDALTLIPPEIASDIAESGVVISGGTALLAGLREYIERGINIPVRIVPDPIASVAKGITKLK